MQIRAAVFCANIKLNHIRDWVSLSEFKILNGAQTRRGTFISKMVVIIFANLFGDVHENFKPKILHWLDDFSASGFILKANVIASAENWRAIGALKASVINMMLLIVLWLKPVQFFMSVLFLSKMISLFSLTLKVSTMKKSIKFAMAITEETYLMMGLVVNV